MSARARVVVVGGGSAGAVVAAELSARSDAHVTVLEAGRAYRPSEYPPHFTDARLVGQAGEEAWYWAAEPGALRRSLNLLAGKVLGGSSAINAAVAMRGLRSDFDRWVAAGARGWDPDSVYPHYAALENTVVGEDSLHGRQGPLPIAQTPVHALPSVHRAFVQMPSRRAASSTTTSTDIGGRARGGSPSPS
jgi:choline dehydrogenase